MQKRQAFGRRPKVEGYPLGETKPDTYPDEQRRLVRLLHPRCRADAVDPRPKWAGEEEATYVTPPASHMDIEQ